MSYVIVGVVCLMVGGVVGMFITALITINRNTESVEPRETDIYMGTCSLSATHAVPEEEVNENR